MAGKQVCHISSVDEDDQLWKGNKSVTSVPWIRSAVEGKQVCHISSMDEDDQLWKGNKSVTSVPWMRTISCGRETSLSHKFHG